MMEPRPQQELQAVCRRWSADLKAIDTMEGRMAYFRVELPALLSRRWVFEGILKGILAGNPYPDLRQETLFDNEVVLFREPGRKFSLRLYVFGPGEHTAVHDHTSWGVSGPAFGQLKVVRYRLEGLGSEPNHARLAVDSRRVLSPGEIETTLPFAEGIHCTGNPSDGTILMVSVYGRPMRRLYLQRFHLRNGRIERLYPPRLKKRMLAEQALKAMETCWTPN